VIELVAEGRLATLDNGALIESGRLDVPVVRRSWATALQVPTDGGSRVLDPPEGQELHPAVEAAAEFHTALQVGDAEAAFALTSRSSRAGMDADTVLEAWYRLTGGKPPESAGIGTAIYSLAPLAAVAARVIADAPKVPRAMSRPTPARMLTPLPLVEENGEWKADLDLMEREDTWIDYLTQPMPQSSADGEGRSNPPDTASPTKVSRS
jgi:hypothetical protein